MQRPEQAVAPCGVSHSRAVCAICIEDNTHCKLQMFWQQILQLGNAFVDSVTSFLLDQAVWQLVCLLERVEILPVKPTLLSFKW